MSNALVWFRDDLRTIDHEPLYRAAGAERTFALVCLDPRRFATTRFGFERTGPHRTKFLLESVSELRSRLRELGGDLVVRLQPPETAVPAVTASLGVDTVHFHRHVGSEETRTETVVTEKLNAAGINIKTAWGHTLMHPDDLSFDIGQTPEVFTKFRKVVERDSHERTPLAEPDSLSGRLPEDFDLGEIPKFADLGVEPPWPDGRAHRDYVGGQTAGLARIDEYFFQADRLRVYKETRNGMLNVDDSSKLSPWLAVGALSPRTVAAEVRRYENERVSNQSTYWLIFELLWRDYFRFITAKHGRHLFQVEGIRRVKLNWQDDAPRFEAWREGRTGYPIVDANMRELALTGYMSNRGRQNVASFLTKNLGIDWRMGAEWFESRLIDYDVASNWGNWNYAAGVGNDARGFRFFNVTKQARDYDPDGEYVRHWCPELSNVPPEKVHEPWKLDRDGQKRFGVTIGVDYPAPIVDLFQSADANRAKYDAAMSGQRDE